MAVCTHQTMEPGATGPCLGRSGERGRWHSHGAASDSHPQILGEQIRDVVDAHVNWVVRDWRA
jgi:hypothetical protein